MKVTAEHLAVIRAAVEPLDTPERRERYRAGAFPRADAVQDLDKRYRWDLFHVVNNSIAEQNRARRDPEPFLSAVLYDAGYHDGHIDTALRAVVPALEARDG